MIACVAKLAMRFVGSTFFSFSLEVFQASARF